MSASSKQIVYFLAVKIYKASLVTIVGFHTRILMIGRITITNVFLEHDGMICTEILQYSAIYEQCEGRTLQYRVLYLIKLIFYL